MKRCDNCGFENQAHSERCEKCGARLGDVASPPASNPVSPPSSESKKTVKGKAVNRPFLDEPEAKKEEVSSGENSSGQCTKCGYPVREEAASCPNCGFATGQASGGADKINPTAKKTMAIADFEGFGAEKPSFMLLDEKNDKSLDFNGENVSLHRENLDPENMSISGEEHARFEFKDGKWFISDHSSNGATFIQVNRSLEVKDGDMIILGQKVFRFKEK